MKTKIILLMAVLALLPSMAAVAREEGPDETEFNRIMTELEQKKSTVAMPRLVEMGERMFLDLISKYPGTKGAGRAHLMLGQIYSGMQRFDEAISHLEKYFEGDHARDAQEEGLARYALGSTYVAMGDFGNAEKHFRQIVDGGSAVDQKTKKMGEMMLERMDTLKRLVIGAEIPDFSATATDGKGISLEQYRGKVLLLDFWATWCAPCRAEMPNVIRVYDTYREKGFDIVGISFDNSREKFDNYIKDQKMGWRQVFDGKGWQSEVGKKYAISSIPATFLIDREGKIRYKNLRGEDLEDAVKELLAK